MEPSLATRIESDLAIPARSNLDIVFSPSKVWAIARGIHARSTEAARYIAQTTLDNFRQGFKVDLEEHMMLFRKLKDQLILSGRTTTSEDIDRRLIHSLHNKHKSLRQHLLRNIRPITYSGVEDKIKLMSSEEKAAEANEINANLVFEGNSTSSLQSQKGKSNFRTKMYCNRMRRQA